MDPGQEPYPEKDLGHAGREGKAVGKIMIGTGPTF